MAQNITLLGASYSAVPAVTLPKTGGGTARFDDCSVVTASASDVASGKIFVASDGTITTGTSSGGGGGIGTLLATKSLGTISTSSTSATDMGQTVKVDSINDYDMLLVFTTADSINGSGYLGTAAVVWLTASVRISEKTGGQVIATYAWMSKYDANTFTTTSRTNTTRYGIYPQAVSLNDGDATLTLYQRYSSTYTGTINNSYTTRVYGVNLYDLIGG